MKFFRFLFGEDGDKTAISDTTNLDGTVSYEEGFGADYSLDPLDPDKKNIERDKFNQFAFDVTTSLKLWQTQAFPAFITSSMNGGTAYSYGLYAFVRGTGHAGEGIYVSIVGSNTSDLSDATKWALYNPFPSQFSTGMTMYLESSILPSGWIWANGLTIGNASSGATNRANADCEALFIATWNSFPQSVRPLQDSSGSVVSRGISAAADWAANRRIPVMDSRENIIMGAATMGGAPAPSPRRGGNVVNTLQLGASGGNELSQLSANNLPSSLDISVTFDGVDNGAGDRFPEGLFLLNINGVPTQSTSRPITISSGSSLAFSNTQPSIVSNLIIKL